MSLTLERVSDRSFSWTTSLGRILAILTFTGLTALAAQIKFYLPFTPVPITLQSAVVILSGCLLGARSGALSQILLLAFGASGFSVFAQSSLYGPSAGYLVGFIFASFAAGWMVSTLKRKSFFSIFIVLFLSSLFIFIPGVIVLKVWTASTWTSAFGMGFWPFMPGDFLKSMGVASIVWGLRKSNVLS